jgi:phosphatidylserine/phosphatidylglycerophosphate/cardiolipin synthase-like enzyme
MIEVVAAANCDDVNISWKTPGKLPGCLGFALKREPEGGTAEFLQTSMPFEGHTANPGETQPSSVLPIQRFVWTDHLAPTDVRLRYRVCPVEGSADAPQLAAESEWSAWTDWVSCATGQTPGFQMWPNRGVVAAPWVDRRLDALGKLPANVGETSSAILTAAIATAGDQLRTDLGGPVLEHLREQFATAKAANESMYVALYELRDDELTDLLIAAGDRAHVIVANGAFSSDDPDPNKPWADRLAAAGIDVQRRLVSSPHYAHNKFIVFVDGATSTPKRVWTGSTNWTPSGLCTQANHAVLIDDETIARGFLEYWQRIHAAGSGYPTTFAPANGTPASSGTPPVSMRAWFVPVLDFVDLDDARALISAAQQGALFLMFRPGNDHTLVDQLKALHTEGKFIRGVVNTNFLGQNTAPTIQFFNKSATARHASPELILPDHLRDAVANDDPEVGVQGVLIHSKTIVLDPFGDHPVVMTGSHNLGEKASKSNDDNLVIIEHAPGLAREFAVYIMNVYDQYKWRYEVGLRRQAAQAAATGAAAPRAAHKPWNGLKTKDTWQNASYLADAATEAAFWFGG